MARRRKTSKKIQPAVTSLFFKPAAVNPNSTQTLYADLSQIASVANRRFYRQGLNWAVSSIKVMSYIVDASQVVQNTAPLGRVSVSKVPTTWVASNAWEKAFRHWQKMNRESDGTPGKFHDFKVYLDETHFDDGGVGNMMPIAMPQDGDLTSLGNSLATAGTWDYSKFVVPDADGSANADEYSIMMVGDNYPSGKDLVSMIKGYANSRAIGAVADLDPNTPGEMADIAGNQPENWLTALFNEGTRQDEEVTDLLLAQNTQAPYPFENDADGNTITQYPGSETQLAGPQIHAIEPISGTTIGGTTYIQGGQFPCGLIRFDTDNQSTRPTDYLQSIIQIDLVPGDHRGYLAESMVEM